MPFTLAQISDTHLVADPGGTVLKCPVHEGLQAVVALAKSSGVPDAVLHTGDLSQDGTSASYAALGAALRPLEAPCYALPGNHDVADTMQAELAKTPFRPERSFTAGAWRIVLLDSAVPGQVYGRLSDEALAEAERHLAAHPEVPTLIALHHPPVPPGAAWLDPLGLHEPEAFLDLIADHPQVRLVLFGHIHQEMDAQHAQARLLSTPATCFQFAPDVDKFALDDRRTAGYRRLKLFDDGHFETHVERVERAFTLDHDAAGY